MKDNGLTGAASMYTTSILPTRRCLLRLCVRLRGSRLQGEAKKAMHKVLEPSYVCLIMPLRKTGAPKKQLKQGLTLLLDALISQDADLWALLPAAGQLQ